VKVTNALAYCDKDLITAVKSCMVKAPGAYINILTHQKLQNYKSIDLVIT
jgi:hypothetical protein